MPNNDDGFGNNCRSKFVFSYFDPLDSKPIASIYTHKWPLVNYNLGQVIKIKLPIKTIYGELWQQVTTEILSGSLRTVIRVMMYLFVYVAVYIQVPAIVRYTAYYYSPQHVFNMSPNLVDVFQLLFIPI